MKKTDEFIRRLLRALNDNSNFNWVEQNIKDLAKEAVDERIEKLETELETLKSEIADLKTRNQGASYVQ